MNIAAMASHGGSILQAVIDACEDGTIAASVTLVVSNNSDAPALKRAKKHGIETLHLSARTHGNADELDEALTAALGEAKADWILLAGYMKKLGPQTLGAYRNRILNTHPSLLPKYGGQGLFGRNVHQAVLDAGETESGATVHLVAEEYDSGPILSQV
ncbi:MAG: phosphoribosylglycinamide formyltransferase, partial [Pseudomonadales bacterium]